jgi:hypothetical protein
MLFICCLTLDLGRFLLIGAIVLFCFSNFWYMNVYQMTEKLTLRQHRDEKKITEILYDSTRIYNICIYIYVLKDLILHIT